MRSTAEIVNAIVDRLQALEWTPAGGRPEPAFGEVFRFNSTDIGSAFQSLLASKQRVALVVPMARDWGMSEASGGRRFYAMRDTQISVVVSDRVHGQSARAWAGDDNTPGAWGLADLVTPSISGQLFASTGPGAHSVDLFPTFENDMEVADERNPRAGRAAVVLEFVAKGGFIEMPKTPGPSH